MQNLRLIELFAGYGSQAMALKRVGIPFEHYKVIEFDKYAVKSYNAVHGTDFKTTDIRDIRAKDLDIVDTDKYTYLLTYSFPCTDLSVAGKMEGMSKGSGTRSGLLWEVERILNECDELPQFLLMENVPQVHGKKNKQDFADWISFLDSKGYISKWQDLNAKDYGVAQNRNRCFMISFLDKNTRFEFPKPFDLKKQIKDYLEDVVDDKYCFTAEKTKELINEVKNIKNDSKSKRFNPKEFDVFSRIKSREFYGAGFKTISPTLCARDYKGPVQTIVLDNNSFIIRNLIPLEYFRLMGVSDEDAFKMLSVNSNTQCYKQAGNSIVVDVMVEIFKNLFLGGSDQLRGQMDIYDFIK